MIVIVQMVSVDIDSVNVLKNGHNMINNIPIIYVRSILLLIDDNVEDEVDWIGDVWKYNKMNEIMSPNKTNTTSIVNNEVE